MYKVVFLCERKGRRVTAWNKNYINLWYINSLYLYSLTCTAMTRNYIWKPTRQSPSHINLVVERDIREISILTENRARRLYLLSDQYIDTYFSVELPTENVIYLYEIFTQAIPFSWSFLSKGWLCKWCEPNGLTQCGFDISMIRMNTRDREISQRNPCYSGPTPLIAEKGPSLDCSDRWHIR